MASAGGAVPPRKVSFLFRREGIGHCGGVNALALSRDEQQLWTGSRDSTICCWSTAEKAQPDLMHEHVGHIDWVNGLALAGDVLVSCSSDKTLRVWQPDSPEPALGCLQGHSDYVTALAACADGSVLASGGLRGEVLLWDLATLRGIMAGSTQDQGYSASTAEVPRASVYAVAINAAGTLIAAGSTQGVSVVDVRSGRSVMQLKGHTDNVRSLQLEAEGRLLLSGSADHTMRLWDLGQQRCVQTLAVHTDSVWALAATPSFAAVFSGGRDGCIYRTRLSTRVSELLAVEQRPVLALAVASDERRLWAATTAPSVHTWHLELAAAASAHTAAIGGGSTSVGGGTPRSPLGAAAGAAAVLGGPCFIASPSAAARARLPFAGQQGSHPPPQQGEPAAATPGLPPIQHAVVLTDRRHVLTRDADGTVLCWDLTAGCVTRDYGRCELKEVEVALFQPNHSVSAWCQPEVKLGSLGGAMEPPQCFGAEIYAQDLGDEEAPVDLKVNFGEQMLVALFKGWAEAAQRTSCHALPAPSTQVLRPAQERVPGSRAVDQQSGAEPSDSGGSHGGDGERQSNVAAEQAAAGGFKASNLQDGDSEGQSIDGEPDQATRFKFLTPLAPVVMVSGSGGSGTRAGGTVPWRCPTDAFTGKEDVPQWVADCVLRGRYPVSRELKMAFQLMPLPGSPLPSLLQSKLNAPRVLRVNKVADYIRRKMEEQGIALREEPLFWDGSKEEKWHAEQAASADGSNDGSGGGLVSLPVHQLHPVQPFPGAASSISPAERARGSGLAGHGALLVTCAGNTVPWDFSLAAVRQWIWRRSDDLVLHYSVRDRTTPLKLPAIRRPS
ncbi:hypothetical protein D9Q98_003949 [Chlorella vulgaris]|uniref:Uncharacterized protein n=1 Tax=Chlorella vulgaris TaxID=3077 RepID=A0A9D4TR62_CHLVU|nr:hypothetical protein D9Q98_003949 [Chlorella vulgaris]